MRIAYRRRIIWFAVAALFLQVLLMSGHHAVHGASVSPTVTAQADHESHHHSQDSNSVQTTPVPCPFWLALHAGAGYVPPIEAAHSVRPSSFIVMVHFDVPFISPQYLLTDLSSRGPPLFTV